MNTRPKKSLGQNFLNDQNVVNRIIKCADLSNEDVVLEIGPGKGILTEKIAKVCKKVVAIEIDERLVKILYDTLRNKENIEIVHDDVLKINLPELVEKKLKTKSYKLVANIPHYITSQIIRLLLETKYPPKEMILMVQKEVAERIIAKPGNMSILAVSVQYYAKPEYLFTVPKVAFKPQPEVDSAVIRIVRNLESVNSDEENVKKFFRIVRSGFSARRKTLANNLSSSLKMDKREVEKKIESLGFLKNIRAQELRIEDWKSLANVL